MLPIQLESVAVSDGGGDDRAVLRIGGELDAYTAPRLRERITDLVRHGSVHLIADMRGVEFMDSTGLGVLVGGLKMARAKEGTLALVIGDPRIMRIFQVTGLTKHFPIHPTVVAAISGDGRWRQLIGGAGSGEGAGGVEAWCRKHGLL